MGSVETGTRVRVTRASKGASEFAGDAESNGCKPLNSSVASTTWRLCVCLRSKRSPGDRCHPYAAEAGDVRLLVELTAGKLEALIDSLQRAGNSHSKARKLAVQ